MRGCFVLACVAFLTSLALAQHPTMPVKTGESGQPGSVPADLGLKEMFEAKIKAEWDALKNKDKKAYSELLTDDYEGVEADGAEAVFDLVCHIGTAFCRHANRPLG